MKALHERGDVMDMPTQHQDQLIFHLTGRRQGSGLTGIEGLALRPALLAPYRDLGALRHDFPVVLDEQVGAPEFVRSLSSLVDAVLKEVAPRGIEGERLRRHGLQLEREIRRAVDAGAGGTLSECGRLPPHNSARARARRSSRCWAMPAVPCGPKARCLVVRTTCRRA